MKPMDIIFVGACIVGLGALIGAIGSRMQNKASSVKSDKQLAKVAELSEQNNVLINSVTELSSQNSELASNISTLSAQNAKLMAELSNARDDVGNARLEALDHTFGSMDGVLIPSQAGHLKLYNESKLPMYDVNFFITDYDKLLLCKEHKDRYGNRSVESSCYNNATKTYKVDIIYGNSEVDFPEVKTPLIDQYKFSAKIMTKKGTYYQQLINSRFLGIAYRILKPDNVAEYYEQFIPNKDGSQKKVNAQTFTIVIEKNFSKDPVDWDKEFPIPVSFILPD